MVRRNIEALMFYRTILNCNSEFFNSCSKLIRDVSKERKTSQKSNNLNSKKIIPFHHFSRKIQWCAALIFVSENLCFQRDQSWVSIFYWYAFKLQRWIRAETALVGVDNFWITAGQRWLYMRPQPGVKQFEAPLSLFFSQRRSITQNFCC